jgi:hypothetical protein
MPCIFSVIVGEILPRRAEGSGLDGGRESLVTFAVRFYVA